MRFFRAAYAVAWKDVLLELRRKETFTAMFFFSLLVLLMFNFTLNLDRTQVLSLAPGLLWLAITFTGVLGLGKGFLAERENECMDGLILSPVPRGAIFLG
ncbi:MAG: heme exporter protein CcmB, partial [Nitrospirae bacterium]|nr:heme exporter protein CcmB [Nitrospirota bacterium]